MFDEPEADWVMFSFTELYESLEGEVLDLDDDLTA